MEFLFRLLYFSVFKLHAGLMSSIYSFCGCHAALLIGMTRFWDNNGGPLLVDDVTDMGEV